MNLVNVDKETIINLDQLKGIEITYKRGDDDLKYGVYIIFVMDVDVAYFVDLDELLWDFIKQINRPLYHTLEELVSLNESEIFRHNEAIKEEEDDEEEAFDG